MLELNDLRVQRDGQQFVFSLRAEAGSIIAVQGVSGVGKSTLLETIAGFVPVTSGSLLWEDQDLTRLPAEQRPVAMLFQDHNLFEHLKVRENLRLSLQRRVGDLDTAARALGIAELLDRLPAKLSGGQRQRAALLRTMLRDEPLILLDEPFSELDDQTRATVTAWTREQARQQHKTVLVVTHQSEDVTRLADRVIHLAPPSGQE